MNDLILIDATGRHRDELLCACMFCREGRSGPELFIAERTPLQMPRVTRYQLQRNITYHAPKGIEYVKDVYPVAYEYRYERV